MNLNPMLWPVWGRITGLVIFALAVAACGTVTAPGSNPATLKAASSAPASSGAEPGVTTYICQGTGWDELFQWRDDGSGDLAGSYEDSQLSGQAPSEQVSSSSGDLSGTLNGTGITLNIGASQPLYGTLRGGTLTLNVPQSDGSMQADTCSQGSLSDWNNAVASLDSQAGQDNGQANQTAAGCVAAENDARTLSSKITADDNAISRDEGNASAEHADIQRFITDMQTLQSELNAAQAEARQQSVQAKIGVMSTDLGIVVSDLQAVERGDTSKVSQLDAAAGRLQGDGNAIDSLCSTL